MEQTRGIHCSDDDDLIRNREKTTINNGKLIAIFVLVFLPVQVQLN